MLRRRILIAEDEAKTRETVELYLRREGFEVTVASDGAEALAKAEESKPHLVILDVMMPRVDGIEVCRLLRSRGDVPVILLTARSTEEDKLRGLDLGADDYVTKPFSPRELMARVRSLLRRAVEEDVTTLGAITIDRPRSEVRVGGTPVTLTPTEFRLLETLARSPSRTFTRQELVERAFDGDYEGLDRTVDVHIKNLRRKLGAEAQRIATVFGTGYKAVR